MANPEHLAILKQGVEAWNEWRKRNRDVTPDLGHADLSGANLSNADLSGANLNNANLSGANLSDAILMSADLFMADLRKAKLSCPNFNSADLMAADLRETDLSGADLSFADASDANLSGVDLTGADLKWTHLNGAILTRANFSNVEVAYTSFGENDLSTVKGLGTVLHRGPSRISVGTLYISAGKIPGAFLRGAGVPEEVIENWLPVIRTDPAIQWHSCFISYSTKDEEFARRLHGRMREAGLRVWFAPEDVRGGDKLYDQINRAIQLHDKLLLILSKHSIRSDWVMTEIRKTREIEKKENRRKLFPIRLVDFDTLRAWTCFDADTGKDLAVEVREYFIPDFSNWKDHDAFEAAFARLVADLKAEESKK